MADDAQTKPIKSEEPTKPTIYFEMPPVGGKVAIEKMRKYANILANEYAMGNAVSKLGLHDDELTDFDGMRGDYIILHRDDDDAISIYSEQIIFYANYLSDELLKDCEFLIRHCSSLVEKEKFCRRTGRVESHGVDVIPLMIEELHSTNEKLEDKISKQEAQILELNQWIVKLEEERKELLMLGQKFQLVLDAVNKHTE